MKLVFKILVIGCLFTLTTSCIEDYDMDFSLSEKILTLNAELEPNRIIRALIALPKEPGQFGDFNTPDNVEVNVFEDGEFFETLYFKTEDNTHGIYASKKPTRSGRTYTIEAEYNDLPKIKGSQRVVDYPVVLSAQLDKDIWSLKGNDTVEVQINLEDNGRQERFVAVNSYLYVSWRDFDEDSSSYIREDTFGLEIFNEDNAFRDHNWDLVLSIGSSNTIKYSIVLVDESFHPDNLISISIQVPVMELSDDAYRYRYSHSKRYQGNYGENVTLYSNIENGLGIMSSKAIERISFR